MDYNLCYWMYTVQNSEIKTVSNFYMTARHEYTPGPLSILITCMSSAEYLVNHCFYFDCNNWVKCENLI